MAARHLDVKTPLQGEDGCAGGGDVAPLHRPPFSDPVERGVASSAPPRDRHGLGHGVDAHVGLVVAGFALAMTARTPFSRMLARVIAGPGLRRMASHCGDIILRLAAEG